MDPFDVYKYYMSMKLHFESDTYDALKYNYKTSAKPQAFFKRRDKYHFAKLGRKYESVNELINFFVAQFTHSSNNIWVGNMLNDEGVYDQWKKRIQSLSYTFETDINKLSEEVESFDDLFSIKDDSPYPVVVNAYMQETITLETLVILESLTGFLSVADKKVTDPIVWPEISKRIRKYKPFLNFNDLKIKNIIFRVFTS